MPIIVDGVDIQGCDGVTTDGTVMELVDADATNVYTQACHGTIDIPDTQDWTVPQGVHSVDVCIVGGGGGGAFGLKDDDSSAYGGGGYAGDVVSQIVNVTPGETITVTIGEGGLGNVDNTPPGGGNITPGHPGGNSTFGAYVTSIGGAGGTGDWSCRPVGYMGSGASRTTCLGTSTDGNHGSFSGGDCGHVGYGGQSSGIGKGGNAYCDEYTPGDAEHGGIGAGGGGCVYLQYYNGGHTGNGGKGFCRLTW